MDVLERWAISPSKRTYGVQRYKFHPITCHEGTEGEQKYSPSLHLTSALDGSRWLTPRLSRFIPGKGPGIHSARCVRGSVCRGAEYLAPQGFDPRTVQPAASRCTSYSPRTYRVRGFIQYVQEVFVQHLNPLRQR